ncbi:hypothetical protein [Kingella potus]|nr:hypothetical protein [Kingella potus]
MKRVRRCAAHPTRYAAGGCFLIWFKTQRPSEKQNLLFQTASAAK